MSADPRFARLKTDPRFRRPRKHKSKVVVDDRFKEFLDKKPSKKSAARVDKYGRSVSLAQDHENLKRFYRLDTEDDGPQSALDLARGEVLLESSDEEDNQSDVQPSDDDSESDGGYVAVGADPQSSVRDQELDIDLDEDTLADLDAQAEAYQKANPDADAAEEEGAEPTSRLAVVNLDWDHVRAIHLYKIFSSLLSPSAPARASKSAEPSDAGPSRKRGANAVSRGRVLSVRVYPSEFGKARMAVEEKEGPPAHIFKKRNLKSEDEVNERTVYELGDEEEHDEDALRTYQLERLRYYYAIVTCDTSDAAAHLFEELQASELERSANVFDLSFVPEDMTFDDDPRDEATENQDVAEYKAVEFVTDALRHSKVKLTWDEDDPQRTQVTRRKLTQKEIDEGDFRNYLASSSDESEGESSKQALSRDRLRALLLGGKNELPEGWAQPDGAEESDVDMEITFTPGLDASKGDQEETTIKKYQRKQREKRKQRKAGKEKEQSAEEERDEFFAASDDEGVPEGGSALPNGENDVGDASQLVSGNAADEAKHFNMKDVIKAEKVKKRKGKKTGSKKSVEELQLQEDFQIDASDDRFKALFEDHNYAIDPSNPHFNKTSAMDVLLAERTKRRKDRAESKPSLETSERSLYSLVESVKRKSSMPQSRSGKRRKLK